MKRLYDKNGQLTAAGIRLSQEFGDRFRELFGVFHHDELALLVINEATLQRSCRVLRNTIRRPR